MKEICKDKILSDLLNMFFCCLLITFAYSFRVDSRLRECDNYAFFAILAQNFKFPA